ncbi:MAG: VWA domain-containing protein, partial [Myxococcales bacterium]|nr:VWA domain-containing protein [Myxococcales bacterium]
MRLPLSLLLFVAACAGSVADSAGGSDSPLPPPAPGENGAQDLGELRAILDRGEIPGAETLDANGFFNEHYNKPSAAGCGNVLCITPGMSVGRDWLTGAHQATLQLSVSTNIDPAAYPRLPMNLVVVVDHSGSMSRDNRLTKVKHGLHTMIDQLGDEDRLAIVQFDDVVDVLMPLGPSLDRPALHAIIDRLQPRGATNIYDGLEQGFRLIGDVPVSERQNRVILLSDGLATAGDTSQIRILQMGRKYVQRGIGLTTIGVGDEFDVALMRGLAEQGAGNYYFLEDPAAADEVFTEELDFFMQPLALDIQLEANAGPGYRFGEVVGSRLWSSEATTGSMSIPAVFHASRTTQSGEQGRRGGGSMIFIHVTPIAGNTGRVANVKLSYRLPNSPERIYQSISLDYTSDPEITPEQPYLSSPEMAERFGMYNLFLGLRAALLSYDPGCAMAALGATRAAATAWNQAHEDPDIAADLMLLD